MHFVTSTKCASIITQALEKKSNEIKTENKRFIYFENKTIKIDWI